jgi:hypothetical protein
MLKPWLKRTLQIVGTLALVAFVVIVYRKTDWCKGFTPDGIMTLIAGVLAFAAVQWQMWDQRRTLRQEQERQNRAVATAILFEIDSFYAVYLRQPRDFLAGKDIEKDELPRFTLIGPNPFPVYRGNTGKIGELLVECVHALVGFFQQADSILSNLSDYSSTLERQRRMRFEASTRRTLDNTLDLKMEESLARKQLGRIKGVLPEAIKAAYLVCHVLCQFADVPFEYPTVTVAAEKLSVDQIKDSLLGRNSGSQAQPADAKKN